MRKNEWSFWRYLHATLKGTQLLFTKAYFLQIISYLWHYSLVIRKKLRVEAKNHIILTEHKTPTNFHKLLKQYQIKNTYLRMWICFYFMEVWIFRAHISAIMWVCGKFRYIKTPFLSPIQPSKFCQNSESVQFVKIWLAQMSWTSKGYVLAQLL